MLESLLSFILNKQLTGLLANFSSSNLEINLRAGRLLLQGLSLLPEATAGWGLPFAIKSATIGRLEVLLPWRQKQLSSRDAQPLVVSLDGVVLVLDVRVAGGVRGMQTASKASPAPPATTSTGLDASQYQMLTDYLLRSLQVRRSLHVTHPIPPPVHHDSPPRHVATLAREQVSVTNLVVRLEEGSTGGGIECALDCLELRCHRQEELPRLLALCLPAVFKRAEKSREQGMKLQLEAGVRVTWRGTPLASGGAAGAEAEAAAPTAAAAAAAGEEEAAGEEAEQLLAPLHVSADLDMTLTFPAAEEARLQPPMLALSGRLDVGELALRLSLAHLAALARMAHGAAHAAHHERYRALRPACAPRDGPRRWWRFAHAAVALDLREERERLSWRSLRTRAQLLASYEARYEEWLLLGEGGGKGGGDGTAELFRNAKGSVEDRPA